MYKTGEVESAPDFLYAQVVRTVYKIKWRKVSSISPSLSQTHTRRLFDSANRRVGIWRLNAPFRVIPFLLRARTSAPSTSTPNISYDGLLQTMASESRSSPSADIDDDRGRPQPLARAQANTHGSKPLEPKRRTRTGCLNCSRRRRKCDEVKPNCTGCKRRGEKCQWRTLGSFRDSNITVLASDHPSMNQGVTASKNKRQSKFKILNTSPHPAHSRKHRSEDTFGRVPSPSSVQSRQIPPTFATPTEDQTSSLNRSSSPVFDSNVDHVHDLSQQLSGTSSSARLHSSSHASPQHGVNHQKTSNLNGPQQTTDQESYPADTQSEYQPHSLPDDSSSHAYLNSSPGYVIDEIAALRSLTHSAQFHASYQTSLSPLFDHSVFSDTVDLTNDIFLPGSAYEALHTTLRNRQLWTARPDVPSRRSSRGSISQVHTPTDYSGSDSHSRTGREHQPSKVGRYFELSPEREHFLWQNYLDEICSWVRHPTGDIGEFSADCSSWICSIIIVTLLLHFPRWPRPHLTCVIPFSLYLRDSLNDCKTRSRSLKAYRSIKRQFTYYCLNWRARQPL